MIYEYKCPECGKSYEEFQGMNDKHSCLCLGCNVWTERVWTPHRFVMEFRGGWDAGLGEYVDTKKQRETFMRDKNLVRQKN